MDFINIHILEPLENGFTAASRILFARAMMLLKYKYSP